MNYLRDPFISQISREHLLNNYYFPILIILALLYIMCLATSTDKLINTSATIVIKPKKVTFGGIMGEAEAPQNYRITRKQKEVLWYDRADLKGFRTAIKEILKNNNQIDESDCFRGIEAYVNRSRSLVNKANVSAILQMQSANKRQLGHNDPTGLKSVASCLSQEAVKISILRASQDAMEAYIIYNEAKAAKDVDYAFRQAIARTVTSQSRPEWARSA